MKKCAMTEADRGSDLLEAGFGSRIERLTDGLC